MDNTTMDVSLKAIKNNKTIFTSTSHWLLPLFELEEYLQDNDIHGKDLFLYDKIAGKAAAALIVKLGIKNCHIELLSQRAEPIFKKYGVNYTFGTRVEKISCKTEELISDNMSIEEIHTFLRKRAGLVHGLPVQADNISVYLEAEPVLQDVTFSIDAGEQVLIRGQNGAGKTTLLKTILGLHRPTEGTVRIGPYLVGSPAWNRNRKITGYVHQEGVKTGFPISGGEVVALGLAATRIKQAEQEYQVEIAMRRTGCFHLKNRRYATLSGGEKQRIALARCLCQKAQVILLDEPTSFLDAAAKDSLLDILQDLGSREIPTMILVSHEDSWSDQLDWRTLQIEDGRMESTRYPGARYPV